MTFFWILASTCLVSLISLVGVFALALKGDLLDRFIFCFIGFSAGALIGGAFLHILPEAIEQEGGTILFYYVIAGIIMFFMMERYFYWRHCHQTGGVCKTHPVTYLNLIGDGFHNFIDGMVIAVSFIASFKLGVVTTIAVVLHEIPQELGDFAVLVYGGMTKRRALFYNFVSALAAIVGAVVAYFVNDSVRGFSAFILPFTAGGFIYIAASDLIPEIHKEKNPVRANAAFVAFLLGIGFMAAAKLFLSD